MIEKAEATCTICGGPLDDQGYCRSDACPSNRETIRPRYSQPLPIRRPEPSGTFSVSESQRTTYEDLFSSPAPPRAARPWENIPAGPRVPRFDEEDGAPSERLGPPTRRDLPMADPTAPGKPPRK